MSWYKNLTRYKLSDHPRMIQIEVVLVQCFESILIRSSPLLAQHQRHCIPITVSNCKLKYMIYIRSYQLYIYFLKFRQSFLCIIQISSYRLNYFSTCNINHNIRPIIWTLKTQAYFNISILFYIEHYNKANKFLTCIVSFFFSICAQIYIQPTIIQLNNNNNIINYIIHKIIS